MTPLKNDNHDRVLGHDESRCERCYWKGRALRAEDQLEKATANNPVSTDRDQGEVLVVHTRDHTTFRIGDPAGWDFDGDGSFIVWHGKGKVLQVSGSDFLAAELVTRMVTE